MLSCASAQAQAQSLAANRVWGTETALPVIAQPAPGSAPPREPADGYLSAVPVPAPKDQLRKARHVMPHTRACRRWASQCCLRRKYLHIEDLPSGWCLHAGVVNPAFISVQEMQRMLDEAPIWDRDGDWLAARAAVARRLEARCLPQTSAPAARDGRVSTPSHALTGCCIPWTGKLVRQLIRASLHPVPFTDLARIYVAGPAR